MLYSTLSLTLFGLMLHLIYCFSPMSEHVQNVTSSSNLGKGALLCCLVREGMTEEQVVGILGEPTSVACGQFNLYDYSKYGVIVVFGGPNKGVVAVSAAWFPLNEIPYARRTLLKIKEEKSKGQVPRE